MTVTVPEPGSYQAERPPGQFGPGPPGPPPSGTGTGTGNGNGAAAAELTIRTDQTANRCTMRMQGRLCAETVAILTEHVDQLGCRWRDEVVVDLRSVTGLDQIGAGSLVGLGHYVAGRGGRFILDGANPQVRARLAEAEVQLGA